MDMIDKFVVGYKECAARGHNWKRVWRRAYWKRLPWWVPRWERKRRCKDCGVLVWKERR